MRKETDELSIFNKNETLRHVLHEIDQLGPDEHFMFDLSNEKHHDYWKLLFESHNITEERYPKLHEHFNKCSAEHEKNGVNELPSSFKKPDADGFVNNNAIAGLSSFENNCSALAYSTIIDGTDLTTLVLQILDADTHEVISSTPITDVGNGRYVQIDSRGTSGKRKLKAVLNYAMVFDDKGYHGAVKSDNLAGAVEIPIVIQPVSKPEHEKFPNIMVALSRGAGSAADCDYWFHKGEISDNTIVVPFKGSVKFQSEIQELTPGDSISVNMIVKRAEGGEKKVKPHDMGEVYKWFTRTVDPEHPKEGNRVLEWNLPYDGDGKTAGKAISFEKSPWVADTVTLFQCIIGVKTKNSPEDLVWAFVLSHQGKDATTNDVPGLKYIKPLVFYWHCLAKGTQIRLADGTTRSIELLEGGELVQLNDKGDTLPVRATTLAHFTGDALRLTTINGDQITLSKCHVVMTPGGPKSADELKNGDTVITLKGNAQIKSVETIDFDDDLINLLLGEYDQLKTIGEYGTTMFANNILVGDYQIQTKYLKYKRSHPKNILARLNPEWHTDFYSSIEDQNKSHLLKQ